MALISHIFGSGRLKLKFRLAIFCYLFYCFIEIFEELISVNLIVVNRGHFRGGFEIQGHLNLLMSVMSLKRGFVRNSYMIREII